MAHFKVEAVFTIKGRNHLVIAGNITEGTITNGMYVVLPARLDSELSVQINAIELGTKSVDNELKEWIGLRLFYETEAQCEEWKQLNLEGREITIRAESDYADMK